MIEKRKGEEVLPRIARGAAAACVGFSLVGVGGFLADCNEEAFFASRLFAVTSALAMGLQFVVHWLRKRKRKGLRPWRRKAKPPWDLGSEGEFAEILAEARLTEREARYVRACLSGTTMKEIAAENGVTDSTVRNSFAAIYRKLSLSGRMDLAALGASYAVAKGSAPKELRRGPRKDEDQDPAIKTPS